MGLKFHRQFCLDRFILDFYCPALRVGIELDGFQHCTSSGVAHDRERESILKVHGVSVIRFLNDEVNEIEVVMDRLAELVQSASLLSTRGNEGVTGK
jgi:very-short-patch-repair endonuclease